MFSIVGNILKTLPGYAQDLLGVLVNVSHGLEVVTGTGVAQGALKLLLAFHGIGLYAGLAGFAVAKTLAPTLAGLSNLATCAGLKLLGFGRAGSVAGEANSARMFATSKARTVSSRPATAEYRAVMRSSRS